MKRDPGGLVELPLASYCTTTRDPPLHASTRLALVTSVRLLQDGLTRLLRDQDPSLTVDAVCPDATLVSRLIALAPDVVLVDIATLRGRFASRLRDVVPASCIVVFAVDEAEDDLLACAEIGVAGFVPCDASVDELLAAVSCAQRGERYCSPRLAALIFERLTSIVRGMTFDRLSLTSRQLQIVRLIEEGLSNKEIARNLCIEVSTVKNHVHNLLGKLQVQHRWQAPGVALPDGRSRRPARSSA
jgi:DNA-binding NarL/FixJ family response regulator